MDLNTTWFILLGILFFGYALLDGFDLGVGMLHLFTNTDEHRRLMLNSIGPVWDGNEVWLVTGGGALFAAFPPVYATLFSGFYLPLMLLLTALIFRAVAIEFRSKRPDAWWRRSWDAAFLAGSLLAALLLGITVGNLARGIPLDSSHEFSGSLFDLLSPYSAMVGVTTVALFMMHGSIYVVMKTEGPLHDQARKLGAQHDDLLHHLLRHYDNGHAALCPAHGRAVQGPSVLFGVALLNMLPSPIFPVRFSTSAIGEPSSLRACPSSA